MFFDEKDNPGQGASVVKAPGVMGQSKVSLKDLPPGVKVGDTVELTIKSIDQAGNCAYVVSDEANEGADDEKSEKEETGDEPEAEESDKPSMSADLLTGPMGKLKNYLAQKSVDHQSVM